MNEHLDDMQETYGNTFEDKGHKKGDNVMNQHVGTKGTRSGDPGNPEEMPRRCRTGSRVRSHGACQDQG